MRALSVCSAGRLVDAPALHAREVVRGVVFDATSHWLAIGGDDKIVRVFDTATWTLRATSVPTGGAKKFAAVIFAPAAAGADHPSHVICADRFGDVLVLALTPPVGASTSWTLVPDEARHFGHFSACTSLVLAGTAAAPLVVSADCDERIRVARWPHTFDIQSMCLAHTLCVATFRGGCCWLVRDPAVLVYIG